MDSKKNQEGSGKSRRRPVEVGEFLEILGRIIKNQNDQIDQTHERVAKEQAENKIKAEYVRKAVLEAMKMGTVKEAPIEELDARINACDLDIENFNAERDLILLERKLSKKAFTSAKNAKTIEEVLETANLAGARLALPTKAKDSLKALAAQYGRHSETAFKVQGQAALAWCITCTAACGGCTASCAASCNNGCMGGCKTSCFNSCDSSCLGSCESSCFGVCTAVCTGCTGTCQLYCSSNCTTTCISAYSIMNPPGRDSYDGFK